MAKTANAYLPDKASLTIEISAGDATTLQTIFADITAGTYQMNYTLKQTNPNRSEKPVVREFVTGDDDPIILTSSKNDTQESMGLVLLDDFFLGQTGELGAPGTEFTAWQLFEALFKTGLTFTGAGYSPAGIASGTRDIELLEPSITLNTLPAGDADQRTQASRFNVTITYSNTGAITTNA